MVDRETDYGLEFLLAFDGRIHHLEKGYWIKLEIKRVKVTKERPHGLSYSLTLHRPDGRRLVGFDNAHRVPGSRFRRYQASTIGIERRMIPDVLTRSRMQRHWLTTSSMKSNGS